MSSYYITSIKTTPSVYITRGLIKYFFSSILTFLYYYLSITDEALLAGISVKGPIVVVGLSSRRPPALVIASIV